MGKQGPCYHCGITYTPLWRNGPPEKPVLCNACGSRWRTKGTLANYTPLHARAFESTDSSEYRSARGKKASQTPKQQRSHKRKEFGQDVEFGIFGSEPHYAIGFDEDTSNRSSSGSGISYSEGCIQYGGTAGIDSEGSVHTPVWDSPIPSRKRTCMYRKRPSSVEKLTKGLRYILHEQDTSYLPLGSEDLLFACKTPMVAAEIGLGSVLIRQPKSTMCEEESEASSLLVENKYNRFGFVTQADSQVLASSTQLQNEDGSLLGREKEKLKYRMDIEEVFQEHSDNFLMPNGLLDNFSYSKYELQSCHSPLIFVELKDIINFDSFMEILTAQDRTNLMKYVSSVDAAKVPESLQCMFNSLQFEEALTNFQDLLSEGIFDMYTSGLNPQVQQIVKKLILTDLTKSKWIERYSQLPNRSKRKRVLCSTKVIQSKETLKTKGSSLHSRCGMHPTVKNSLGSQPCKAVTGSDNSVKSPGNRQRIRNPYHENMQTGYTSKSPMEFDVEPKTEFCFSPSSLFASPIGRSSILLDSMGTLGSESFEQDLLLDVPSNVSLQQAELLHKPDWKCKDYKDSLSDADKLENPNIVEEMVNNMWGSEESLEWNGLFWNAPNIQPDETLPNGAALYPGKQLP
ncbi:GATA transcription factor 26 isoform X1 [Cryptomeria japonica]|uniref:GATA transcription factor 26 isoform X1 n=1 Tax=Cryptomeria japonica TaxID=3369 RepID=UPI0025AB61EC|nr:GATA transcription factor 26 isoform X1 [Cryptomeria japonica]